MSQFCKLAGISTACKQVTGLCDCDNSRSWLGVGLTWLGTWARGTGALCQYSSCVINFERGMIHRKNTMMHVRQELRGVNKVSVVS